MSSPNSTPLPEYVTPLGSDRLPRIYLVEKLSEEDLRRLDTAAPPAPILDDTDLLDLPSAEEGLRAMRLQQAVVGDGHASANDAGSAPLRLILFVSATHSSQRMLQTARDLVARLGERRASLQVIDVAEEDAAIEMARHRVAFAPTLLVESGAARTRVVGAATVRALAKLLPQLATGLGENEVPSSG